MSSCRVTQRAHSPCRARKVRLRWRASTNRSTRHAVTTTPFRYRLAATAAALLVAIACIRMAAALNAASDITTEFKYGSIGTEGTVGVPYWLWRVLPEVFPDKLPNRPGNAYAKLGFT